MSNCHIEAESHFRAGDARWICFQLTEKSKLIHWYQTAPVTVRVFMKLARVLFFLPVGIVLRIVAGLLLQFSEILMSGRWMHVSWITVQGEHWEYVPEGELRHRWLPPIFFDGLARKVEGKQ